MNEDDKKQELKQNPKFVTNKAAKGKYRFLQKYYHRGVFYLVGTGLHSLIWLVPVKYARIILVEFLGI